MSIFRNSLVSLISIIFTTGCVDDNYEYPEIEDPFGLIAAEYDSEITEPLIECAENDECALNAEALFWLGALTIGEGTVEFEVSPEELLAVINDGSLAQYDYASPEFIAGKILVDHFQLFVFSKFSLPKV